MGWRAKMDRLRVFGGYCVVRQMQMEVECRDVIQQAQLVDVPKGGERRKLLRAFDDRRTKPPLIVTGTSSAFISERVYCPNRC